MADVNDDIAKYLKGELTPAEMYSLEKKALDDPFIADALEGASELSPDELDDDLAKLQSLLGKRLEPKAGKEVPFWVWPARIAAGLLVVVIASFVIVSLSTDKAPETLAVNKETSPVEEQAAGVTPATEESADKAPESKAEILQDADRERAKNQLAAPTETAKASPPAANPQLEEEDNTPSTLTLQQAKELAANPSADENPIAAEQEIAALPGRENNADDVSKKKDIAASRARAPETDQKSASGAPAEALSRDEAIRSTVIKGTVTSEDGSALPGVNVLIKGTSVGTVTDLSGNYQIAGTNPSATLAFNFIGFKETEIRVGQKREINVELPVDASALSEVVVTGYGTGSTSDKATTETLELASPAGGQKAFKRYLENNLNYPVQAITSRIEGKVTLQFTVESSGQLSDFTIIQGIGHGCDEEAIRLVREGPVWVPTKRNGATLRDKVKVLIKFTLPKNK